MKNLLENDLLNKFLIFLLLGTQLFALGNKVRIMTYNLENYGGYYSNNTNTRRDEDSRNDDYRTIINELNPDIIVAEEIWGRYDGDSRFLDDVLNHNSQIYASAFIDQKNDDNGNDVSHDIGVFYKNQMFQMLSIQEVETANGYLRDVLEVKLKYNETGDTISVYGVHLKAGNENSDILERRKEAHNLRLYLNELPVNTPFVVCGDFNIYTSTEDMWYRLTGDWDDNDGRSFDPIDQVGNWHNNESYEKIHTQSSRYESGGLDDRFDFILISNGIKEHNKIEYFPDSYTAYGNDGGHFNSSVNWQGNYFVSGTIADALYEASDHLPVFADFDFTGVVGIDDELEVVDGFVLEQNYPNPFNPATTISFQLPDNQYVKLNIYDVTGKLMRVLVNEKVSVGRYQAVWDGIDLGGNRVACGIYYYSLELSDGQRVSKKMVLVK